MLNAFVIVVVVIVLGIFGHGAYVLWYARSERYQMDRRIEAVAKR